MFNEKELKEIRCMAIKMEYEYTELIHKAELEELKKIYKKNKEEMNNIIYKTTEILKDLQDK